MEGTGTERKVQAPEVDTAAGERYSSGMKNDAGRKTPSAAGMLDGVPRTKAAHQKLYPLFALWIFLRSAEGG